MSKDAGFPRGSTKQHPLKRNAATSMGHTKASWLVIISEHGAHWMGDCPNLINEMVMLTECSACCLSWLTQLGQFPQNINSQRPCQIIVYEKMKVCGNLGWRRLMYVLLMIEIISLVITGTCVSSASWGALAFLRHLVFISRLASANCPGSPMNKYRAFPRHN